MSRCKYCDFYSTTMLERREEYVEAVLEEWDDRRAKDIRTIYFGGGTPSTLAPEQIKRIITAIGGSPCEVTMEANPGDLTVERLRGYRAAGVNRLSIGVQSFIDRLLHTIGRRHSAKEAIEAVKMAREAGFENLSIDLMYGLPGQTMEDWETDIRTAIALRPEHISCYCLSYEEGTVMTRMLEQGEITETDEETENQMYDVLCLMLAETGYEHYEVSNFALPGRYSKHNSSYWNGTKYIGLGAGAHSYDGAVRSWNVSDIAQYIIGARTHALVREKEILSDEDKHTETVMLGLRTNSGIDAALVNATRAQGYLERGLLREKDGRLIATQDGLHILNQIIRDLI